MPAKILDTPSRWKLVSWKDTAFPLTQSAHKIMKEETEWLTWPVKTFVQATNIPNYIIWWMWDVIWTAVNGYVNWAKTIYNLWADTVNRVQWKIIDNKIKKLSNSRTRVPSKKAQPAKVNKPQMARNIIL